MIKTITIKICDVCKSVKAAGTCIKCGCDICQDCSQYVEISAKTGLGIKSKTFKRCLACAEKSDDNAVISTIEEVVKDAIT